MSITPRVARYALLILAIGQFVTPFVFYLTDSQGLSFSGSSSREPQIVPAGYAFGIWGVIMVLTLIYAIWQATSVHAGAVATRIAPSLSIVSAGFCLWLALAAFPTLASSTVIVFIVMLAGLIVAIRKSSPRAMTDWSPRARGLLWTTLGIYTGWTAVAVWVNLSTSLANLGAPITGTWGTAWQLLRVAAATGVVTLMAFRIRAKRALLVAFAASSAWALTAATVGAAIRSAPFLSVAAGILTVIFTLACLVVLRGRANTTT